MSNDTTLAVVIVEDSIFFADLTLRILKRSGFNTNHRVVSTRTALQTALKDGQWDIILSDNVMPNFNALGALELRNSICSHTPFVIISEDISQKELKEAFDKGCSTYLSKDRIGELPALLKRMLQ